MSRISSAFERIRAGASAAKALGRPFVFCSRTDGVMNGVYDLAEGIRRLQAFEAAGVDILYMPVPPGLDELRKVLASVKKPVNALAAGPLRHVQPSDFSAIGVRRISLGSQIARVTHAAILDTLEGMFSKDTFEPLMGSASSDVVDAALKAGAATR